MATFSEIDREKLCFYLGYYTTAHLIEQQLLKEYSQKVVEYVITLLDNLDAVSTPNSTPQGPTLQGYYVSKVEDIEFSPSYGGGTTSQLTDPAYLIRLISRLLSIPLASNLFEDISAVSPYVAIQVR